MPIFMVIVCILLRRVHINEACTSIPFTVNCSVSNSNLRVINVFGAYPTGNCSLLQIGSNTYLYDPIMINRVWITINNTDQQCISDIVGRKNTISAELKLNSTQELIVLNVTSLYLRMIIVNKGCTQNCIPSSDIESSFKSSNYTLYPVYNNLNLMGPYCLYGGQLDSSYNGAGYRCICYTSSVFNGPSCEYMEMIFNNRIVYFNIFQSSTNIDLRLSMFSIGTPGNVTLLSIYSSTFKKIFEIYISESTIHLVTEGNMDNEIKKVLDNQKWYDINLIVTTTNATLNVNNEYLTNQYSTPQTLSYTSYYLIINELNVSSFSIGLKNVIINSQILDIYNPSYKSACLDRCSCATNQDCNCNPFISKGNSPCFCKPGSITSGSSCVSNNIQMSQMTDSITSTFPLNNIQLTKVDFGFQTLSINGLLLTLTLSNSVTNITIQIVNNHLTLSVTGQNNHIINYNVSNGQIHNVTLNVNPASLEMVLDNNYNYSTYSSYFYGSVLNALSLTLGPMQKPYISNYNNLTTCLTVLRLNNLVLPLDIFPSLSPSFYPQCISGPKCNSGILNCSTNQVCKDDEWQNLKCICIANFTSINSTCIYNLCIINPCPSGRVCSYNAASNNYSCSNVVTTASLWWIAVLIVLILLLILIIVLIVYCCCYRTASTTSAPFISKINENIVTYNEQAGECDYNGPPIDFTLMKTALKNNGNVMGNGVNKQMPDLMNKKDEYDKNNNDLVLDHPLEYGYEGFDSDNVSISSIGSKSGTSEIVVDNLDDIYNIT